MSQQTLTDVHKVYQDTLLNAFRFCIEEGDSIVVFGPSGGGKTSMAYQAIEEKKLNPIYINLSVLERPDFQGWPFPSEDKETVTYATPPNFLPFDDDKYKFGIKSLEKAISVLNTTEGHDDKQTAQMLQERLSKLRGLQNARYVSDSVQYVNNDALKQKLMAFVDQQMKLNNIEDTKENVLIFDEADKAPHEVLQPLLELIQFHRVNGRPLNIRSTMLLCNLPDENAHSENLSHALTKRCKVFHLVIDFNQWRQWAVKKGIHPIIIGFLAGHVEYLLKKDMSKNDPTAYVHPNPRAWEYASNTLYAAERQGIALFDEKTSEESSSSDSLTTSLIAGHLGVHTALKLENWVKYYHKLDPRITSIVEKGFDIGEDLSHDKALVLAVGVCNRVNQSLKKDDKDKIKKYIKNSFRWLGTAPVEIQIAALRSAFVWEDLKAHRISDFAEVSAVVENLKNKLG